MRTLNRSLLFHNYRFWNNCLKEAQLRGFKMWMAGSTKVSREKFMEYQNSQDSEKMMFVTCNLFRYFLYHKLPSGHYVVIYTEAYDMQSQIAGEDVFNQNKIQN